MKGLNTFAKIYLYREPVDMRKSIDGLTAIVIRAAGGDPFDGGLFCFSNRSRSLIKCVYFDCSGFALWMKRLEKDRFRWPKKMEQVKTLTGREMEWLLEGFDLAKMKPHDPVIFRKVF